MRVVAVVVAGYGLIPFSGSNRNDYRRWVAKLAGAVEPATFLAGVGTGAVIVFVAMANSQIAFKRRTPLP